MEGMTLDGISNAISCCFLRLYLFELFLLINFAYVNV